MHERTQDALRYVQVFGKPTLFITFTCNPKWKEIQDSLIPGQTAVQRHDIVARVFKQKLDKLKALLSTGKIFGTRKGYMHTVEWQKRGLPHAHILLWLQEKVQPNDIDKLISAELPDPNEDKELHDIVKAHMVHGPCGSLNRNSPCMEGGKCVKRYPRPFVEETQVGEDGYPAYRRRKVGDGGQMTTIKLKNGENWPFN